MPTDKGRLDARLVPQRPFGSRYKKLNLPPTVPIVGLGCSSFSNFFQDNEESSSPLVTAEHLSPTQETVKSWIDTIQYAIVECGITLLDTAPWYGHGISEVVIGFAMESLLERNDDATSHHLDSSNAQISRDSIIINTKVGRYEANLLHQFDFSYDRTISSVQLSLERMKCHYINVLQLHDPEFTPSISLLLEETIPAMLLCRERGWVKALGITGYPLQVQHEILCRVQEQYGGVGGQVVFDQALTYGHYNMHDTSLFTQPIPTMDSENDTNSDGGHDKSFYNYCHDQSLPLMAAAPLSMGLLTHSTPPFWHPASKELQDACQEAAQICKDHHVDFPTLATVFALSCFSKGAGRDGERNEFLYHPLPCTLIGMSTRKEVDNAVACAKRFSMENDVEGASRSIWTEGEEKVLSILQDEENGPFALVWKNNKYQWDGVREADKFWEQIPGGKEASLIQMKKRV